MKIMDYRPGSGQLRTALSIGFIVTCTTVLAAGFVLAAITHIAHLTEPTPQPWTAIVIWSIGIAVGWMAARRTLTAAMHQMRRRCGLCVQCGYNLTGNVSGICP